MAIVALQIEAQSSSMGAILDLKLEVYFFFFSYLRPELNPTPEGLLVCD